MLHKTKKLVGDKATFTWSGKGNATARNNAQRYLDARVAEIAASPEVLATNAHTTTRHLYEFEIGLGPGCPLEGVWDRLMVRLDDSKWPLPPTIAGLEYHYHEGASNACMHLDPECEFGEIVRDVCEQLIRTVKRRRDSNDDCGPRK